MASGQFYFKKSGDEISTDIKCVIDYIMFVNKGLF